MGFEVGYLISTGDQARLPGSRRPADTQQVPSLAQHCPHGGSAVATNGLLHQQVLR